MARTPLPAGTKPVTLILSAANDNYIAELTQQRKCVTRVAMEQELLFARRPVMRARQMQILEDEAARQRVSCLTYVRNVVAKYAVGLPQMPGGKAHVARTERRTNMNLCEETQRWLRKLCEQENCDFKTALNSALDFAREFLLPPDLFEALKKEADRLEQTPRSLVESLLRQHASDLEAQRPKAKLRAPKSPH